MHGVPYNLTPPQQCIQLWHIQAKDKSPCSYQCQVMASIHCPAGEWREKYTTLPYAPGGQWKLTERIQQKKKKKKIFFLFFTLAPHPPPPISPLATAASCNSPCSCSCWNSHSCFTQIEIRVYSRTHMLVQKEKSLQITVTFQRGASSAMQFIREMNTQSKQYISH